MNKREIRDLFKTHGVTVGENDVWDVNGKPVILHAALERLSAAMTLNWDPPTVIRSERDECVVLCRATRKDGISEWSFGEALIVKDGVPGGNYKVTGKQPGYVYAMGEKRGKDRVIIKLAGLHGAYSNEEADGFDKSNADKEPEQKTSRKADPAPDKAPDMAMPQEPEVDTSTAQIEEQPVEKVRTHDEIVADMIKAIDDRNDRDKIVAFMTNKKVLASFALIGPEKTEIVKEHGRKLIEELKLAKIAARETQVAETSEAS